MKNCLDGINIELLMRAPTPTNWGLTKNKRSATVHIVWSSSPFDSTVHSLEFQPLRLNCTQSGVPAPSTQLYTVWSSSPFDSTVHSLEFQPLRLNCTQSGVPAPSTQLYTVWSSSPFDSTVHSLEFQPLRLADYCTLYRVSCPIVSDAIHFNYYMQEMYTMGQCIHPAF